MPEHDGRDWWLWAIIRTVAAWFLYLGVTTMVAPDAKLSTLSLYFLVLAVSIFAFSWAVEK